MEELKPCMKEKEITKPPRCPDYDLDCVSVLHPLQCWLGWPLSFDRHLNAWTEMPPAGGYCPILKHKSKG